MKKVIFFTLFLVFYGAVCANAQVTIGDNSEPHPGAVLDLKSTKGLKLPGVDILDVNVFQLSADRLDEAVGMIVYNTYDAIAGGQGKGIYIWNGSKWMFMATAIPVASVTVAAQDGQTYTSLNLGSTLQLVATVLPEGAGNKSVTWSVVSTGGAATVTQWGLVTGAGAGPVVIRATSVADDSKYGDYPLIVNRLSGPGTVTGSRGTYTTWCFAEHAIMGNICWMTQNSMEGNYTSVGSDNYTTGSNGLYMGRGYYYASLNLQACPPGWTIPTRTQWEDLQSLMGSLYGSLVVGFIPTWWASAWAGRDVIGSVQGWDDEASWLVNENPSPRVKTQRAYKTNRVLTETTSALLESHSVRCVKSN